MTGRIYCITNKIRRKQRCTIFIFVVVMKILVVSFFGKTMFESCNYYNHTTDDVTLKVDGNSEKIKSDISKATILTWKDHTTNKEVHHIAFLKVHKAASSTAMNIFLRYGYTRDLVFVLPSSDSNVISKNESLSIKNILPPPPRKHFEILCNHVIYNRRHFETHLSRDSVLIGILRDPFQHFISSIYYFRNYWYEPYLMKIPNDNVVLNLLRNPHLYEPKSPAESYTNNRQAFEFGFPLSLFKDANMTNIYSYIHQLSLEFRLVMIAEYFDESIVLLKRYLNWSTKDILYVSKNRFIFKMYNTQDQIRDKKLHKRLAKLDYALYNFFTNKLRNQIRQEGEDFDREVSYFKQLRRSTENFCRAGARKGAIFQANRNKWHRRFELHKGDCDLMLLNEMPFVELIKYRQYPELKKQHQEIRRKHKNQILKSLRNKKERQEMLKRKWIQHHNKARIFRRN